MPSPMPQSKSVKKRWYSNTQHFPNNFVFPSFYIKKYTFTMTFQFQRTRINFFYSFKKLDFGKSPYKLLKMKI